jgi:hypothetical protein
MTTHETHLILDAMKLADIFGKGRTTYARDALADYGYSWTPEHETFVFTAGQTLWDKE